MAAPSLQAAYLLLLDNLVAFKDGDGRPIGGHFCRSKHPEHYTQTYLPSLDEIRDNVVQGKFATPTTFYHKVLRSLQGMRELLPKQDQRSKDSKSLETYFQTMWMDNPNLPNIEEVLAAFESPTLPAPLPKPLPPSHLANGVNPLAASLYTQLLQTLANLQDNNKRSVGQQFVALPPPELDKYFYDRVKNPQSLSTILDRVTKEGYKDPAQLYNDCMTVFDDFQKGSPGDSQRWRNAAFMKVALPRVWSSIPGLPDIPPVSLWKVLNILKSANEGVHDAPPVQTRQSAPVLEAEAPAATQGNASASGGTSANPANTIGDSDTSIPKRLTTRMQTPEEIAKILASSPMFLARMARASTHEHLKVVEAQHQQDGSLVALPSMFGQPDFVLDPTKANYSYPAMSYLLDMEFDEQSSGIRVNPNRVQEEKPTTRTKWAEETVQSLFDSATPPSAEVAEVMCNDLITYSMERHDQEIDMELQASRSHIQILQDHLNRQILQEQLTEQIPHGDLNKQKPRIDLYIWHEQALQLLQEDLTQEQNQSHRIPIMLSRASAVAAMLANQITMLEFVLRAMRGDTKQVPNIFKTGMTASNVSTGLIPSPSPVIPPDVALEPDFRWPPYTLQAKSPATTGLVSSIARDMRLYNRLTPQARDFALAHIRANMNSFNSDATVRRLLLGFLSFYPDHVGLHVTLSCCYTAIGMQVAQAHLCKLAESLSRARGSVSSEALTNLAVAYMTLGDEDLAAAELHKACEAKPSNWEAISSMLFLLTKPHGDSLPGPEQYRKARNFAQGVLQRIYMPIEPLSGSEGPARSEGRADLPHIALSEIYKLQSLYLTTGALAMEAGRPEVALVDYARGVEVILRFTRAVTSPATSGGPAGTTAFHSFRELFNAINIHVQFTHLKSSAHPDAFMKYQAALLQATEGVYDLERIGKETLKCLERFPKLLNPPVIPFASHGSMLPLLLLMPSRVQDLASMALSVGQSNHLVIPPVALAENISMEVRKDADNASRSTLADLCFAMCQVIDLCLVGPNPQLSDVVEKVTGYRPSLASAINLYYFSISLKEDAMAMRNLALILTRIPKSYPATRLNGPNGSFTFQTTFDFAAAWIDKAARTGPPGVVPADMLAAIDYVRSQRTSPLPTG